jgi:hypothetical protein
VCFFLKFLSLALLGVELSAGFTQFLIVNSFVDEARTLAEADTLVLGDFFLPQLNEVAWPLLLDKEQERT